MSKDNIIFSKATYTSATNTLVIEDDIGSGKGVVDIHNSDGNADSEGVCFLDNEKLVYFANTVSDLLATLQSLADSLDLINGLGNSVAVTGLPLSPSIAIQADTLKTQIETLQGELK